MDEKPGGFVPEGFSFARYRDQQIPKYRGQWGTWAELHHDGIRLSGRGGTVFLALTDVAPLGAWLLKIDQAMKED